MRAVRGGLALIGLALVWLLLALPPNLSADNPQRRYGLGLLPSQGDLPRLDTTRLMKASQALPRVVDLSDGLPPVGDQGADSSCVGWALGYYYKTFQEHQEYGWNLNLPQYQFSPAWLYNQRSTVDCSRDAGMSFFDGLAILRDKGAVTLTAMPITPGDTCTQPGPGLMEWAWPYHIEGFANVFAGTGQANLSILKTLLAEGQPIAIAVPVYDSFFGISAAHPVVPRHRPGETIRGGHALLIIGYDDAVGGFMVVNSWGTGWGRAGYAYLAYDFVQYDCFEAWVMSDHVEPVRTVSITLHAGWNLIALPIEANDSRVSDLFAPLGGDLEVLYTWKGEGTNTEPWQVFSPQLPAYANSLDRIEYGRGYWARLGRERTIEISGHMPTTDAISLVPGWNLVGYSGGQIRPAAEALAPIAGRYAAVLAFGHANGNSGWLRYEPQAPEAANTLRNLEPGQGYWVWATQFCTWGSGAAISAVAPELALARAASPPELPSSLGGRLSLRGENVSPGTLVSVWIGETPILTTTASFSDGVSTYSLRIAADNPATTRLDGGRYGDRLRFRIGDSWAAESSWWSPGSAGSLDLSAPALDTPRPHTLWFPFASR
jgi:hypothetical protein